MKFLGFKSLLYCWKPLHYTIFHRHNINMHQMNKRIPNTGKRKENGGIMDQPSFKIFVPKSPHVTKKVSRLKYL